MFIKKLLTSFLVLAASLGVLLALVKSPLASVLYPNALAHSFTLLAITGVLFFVYFFSYQLYTREKDIRYYIVSLSFYVLGVFGFIHSVMVPAFGWGNEALFDISEHYGMFLASFLLLGLIFSFTGSVQETIFRLRTKIFLGVNFFIVIGVALLFLSPGFSNTLFHNVNFFIVLTGVCFLFLLFVLSVRKENDFFTTSLPPVFALFVAAATAPLLYQEWNVVWWYYHLLWLAGPLLLLRAKKGKDITEILFSSFSIRTRLFFIVGLTLVAIVVNGLIDFRLSQNHLQAQTLENLVLMADMQEGQVLNYLEKIKNRTADFSSDGFINNSLEKILYGDKQAVTDLNRHLLENKQPIDPNIFGIHIMDLNGKVVASSRGSEIGMDDMAMDEVFIQARGSRYATAFLSDIVEDHHFGERNIAIMATAPIIDQEIQQYIGEEEQERKEALGVIMLFFKTQGLSDILTGKAQSQLGALSTWVGRKKTMEMYLVNEDKLMLSDSKFILNAPLKQKVDTLPVRLCAKSEEMSGEYLDYREVPVFGASMCFANGWTLLVEIDKDEALATLGNYLEQNLLSGSATFLLILLAVYLFIIGITSPLKELSAAAKKIGVGDFTVRTKLITRDEFGELGAVFNQMAESIQKGSAGLEQKAKEEESSRLAVTNILGDLEVAKKELEQAKAKDEAILGSIGDAVMACDKDGRVMLWNGVAETLTGYSVTGVIGHHYNQLLKLIKESDGKPGNDFIADAIKTGKKTNMTNHSLLITKDGRKIPVADSAAPVKNATGEIIGCVVVFRDVTHEREVDKAKTEFVSLASHQLRTPLSTVNWYSEMLLAGDAGTLNDEQKKYLEEVYKGSKRMVDLVNALLNVSRLELGTFVVEPEPTDIIKLAKSVIDEQKPQIEAKKITLSEKHIDNLPILNADPKLLRIVFQNLLSNAVKYTPEEGTVMLELSLSDANGQRSPINYPLLTTHYKLPTTHYPLPPTTFSHIFLKVSDTGCGIPKNQQDKIFSKLFRADNVREQDTEGTGLGLYIVKSIIDHSGGTISFESQEGKGTTFYVTLPLEGMKKKEGTRTLG